MTRGHGTAVPRPGPLASFPARFEEFDRRVDDWWERWRGHELVDRVFYGASEAGDFGLLWIAISATEAALGPHRKTVALLRLAGALGAESLIVNVGLKSLFRRERPIWAQSRPHALRKPRTTSFPSGHASSAITALILLTDGGTPLAVLYGALAAIVATSRVHVKIHHASDVIGGLGVGLVLGAAIKHLIPLS